MVFTFLAKFCFALFQLFGETFEHEFQFFHSHTEWNFLSSHCGIALFWLGSTIKLNTLIIIIIYENCDKLLKRRVVQLKSILFRACFTTAQVSARGVARGWWERALFLVGRYLCKFIYCMLAFGSSESRVARPDVLGGLTLLL